MIIAGTNIRYLRNIKVQLVCHKFTVEKILSGSDCFFLSNKKNYLRGGKIRDLKKGEFVIFTMIC
jgi:hypothetical protein